MGPRQKCKAAQALFMFEDQLSDDEAEGNSEISSQREDNEEFERSDTLKEVKLSLNSMTGISKPTCIRLMA